MEQEIRFCTTPDGVRIAYAVVGEGPPLVHVPGWISHLELDWLLPASREIWESYARHFTVIRIDKRGTGLSDRNVGDYSLEARVRDLEALVDQLDLGEFALSGVSEGGPTCISYAANHPERVTRMVIYGTFAKGGVLAGGPDLAAGVKAVVKAEWGMGSRLLSDLFVGEDADPVLAQIFTEYQRQGATREDASAMLEVNAEIDVTDLLPMVRAPTLVVHARADRVIPIDSGRELAAGIPNARFVSVEGSHVNPLASGLLRDVALPFLLEGLESKDSTTATAAAGGLVTILFTDMEGSTSLTQRLGDAGAQELLRAHNSVIRDALKSHAGSEIKHTGDGIMASFTTASRALDCAIAIQRAFATRNEENPNATMRVRVGLNAGEPVAEDRDLFGTAVQMAARVCAHAEPGQIVAANVVRELAAGKGFLFSDLGDVTLRGFEDPVRLYEVRCGEDD
jgi:class 3 adenylate cyclase/pimeloyl-ACP methyl ester carboxylesterase